MHHIKHRFWGLLLALSVLWLLTDSFLPSPFTYFSFRSVFIQYSGVLGKGVMSVAIFIATLMTWLERRWGELDKMYRLHKWLGTALRKDFIGCGLRQADFHQELFQIR